MVTLDWLTDHICVIYTQRLPRLDLMAQTPPDWNIIVMGSSGLLGVAAFITKSIVDQKEEQVKFVSYRYEALKEQIQQERSKANAMLTEIVETLKDIDAGKLDAVGAARLREAVSIAEEFPSDLEKDTGDCQRAADWLDTCKPDWVQEACKKATRKYPRLVPWNKRKAFRIDIAKYLDWVCICLYRGGTRSVKLSDFVNVPTISSPHPYIAAITHLIDKNQWGELTSQQRTYLQEVLTRLTEKIQEEFKN